MGIWGVQTSCLLALKTVWGSASKLSYNAGFQELAGKWVCHENCRPNRQKAGHLGCLGFLSPNARLLTGSLTYKTTQPHHVPKCYCHRPESQAKRLACETIESILKFSFPTFKYKKVFIFLLLTSWSFLFLWFLLTPFHVLHFNLFGYCFFRHLYRWFYSWSRDSFRMTSP